MSNPFELLGAPRSFSIDAGELERRYYELSKRLHPDRFAAGGASARARSQQLSAALNQAYLSLKQPEARIETLLKSVGALKDTEQASPAAKNQIPTDLAEEYFEIQEAVMEDSERAATLIASFRGKLEEKRQQMTEELQKLSLQVAWNDPDAQASKAGISKILDIRRERSYLRSMLDNLEKLGRHS